MKTIPRKTVVNEIGTLIMALPVLSKCICDQCVRNRGLITAYTKMMENTS